MQNRPKCHTNLMRNQIWSPSAVKNTSTALLDPWSFIHALMGVFQFWLLPPVWRTSIPYQRGVILNTVAHILFEVVERLPFSIAFLKRLEPEYEGDTLLNSFGDVCCAMAGYSVAWGVWQFLPLGTVCFAIVLLVIHILFYPSLPFSPEVTQEEQQFYLTRIRRFFFERGV